MVDAWMASSRDEAKKARVLRVSSGTAKYDGKRRHYVNWLFKNISVSYLSCPGFNRAGL